jgi:hypothetical protein
VVQFEFALKQNAFPMVIDGDVVKVQNGAQYQINKGDFLTFDRQQAVEYYQMRITPGAQTNFKRAVLYVPFVDGMIMPGYSVATAAFLPPKLARQPSLPKRELQQVSQIILGSPQNSLFGTPTHVAKTLVKLHEKLVGLMLISDESFDLSNSAPVNWQTVLCNLRAELNAIDGLNVDILDQGEATRCVKVQAFVPFALVQGEKALLKFLNKLPVKKYEWPSNWTNGPFTSQDETTFEEVSAGSAEWAEVEEEWRGRSVPPGTVRDASALYLPPSEFTLLNVKRVQNPAAYVRYTGRLETIAKVNNPGSTDSIFTEANQRIMKHGTSLISPYDIAQGSNGLDHRYSGGNCYYGRAAYTAEDAIYSHKYAYKVPDGNGKTFQILLVHVAAGKIYEATKREDFKHPPKGYDSVRGEVFADNMAIMVYSTDEAYPYYLLTYRRGPA